MKRFSKLAALLIWAAMIFAFAGCTDPVTDSDEIVYTFTNQSGVDVILYYNSDAGTEKIEFEDWDGTQITWMCKSFTLSNGESCKIKTLDCKMEMWFSPYSGETSPRFGFAVKNTSDDLLKPTRLKVRDFDYNYIIRQGPYIDSMYFEGINDTTGEGAADRYPAFYFAKNYKDQKIINETVSRIQADSEYANGWYLPSIAELYQIYACCKDTANGFDINEATYYLSNRWYTFDWVWGKYWSSSPHSISRFYDYAYGFDFEKGDCISRSKENSKSSWVCCIREFN